MNDPILVYDEYYSLEADDYNGIIKLYESNCLILDNKASFKDEVDYYDYVLLLGGYSISLENTGKYKKAIRYIERFENTIDSNKAYYEYSKEKLNYNNVLISKGRAMYNLKNYEGASSAFKELIDDDPENDYFKQWYDASKTRNRKSLNTLLYILASIIIIFDLFLGDKLLSKEASRNLSGVGFLLFLIALLNEYVVDKVLKLFEKK